MKSYKLTLLLLLLWGFKSVQGQVTISGTVKNANGDFLHYAFVQDKEYKNGSYTDSLGNFSLGVHENPALYISCPGYKDTVIKPGSRNNLLVIMRQAIYVNARAGGDYDVASTTNTQLLRTTLSSQINTAGANTSSAITRGAELTEIHEKEATQGSRFLLPYWAHGYLVSSADSVIQNPGLLFNYDKIGGSFLFTQDQKTAISVDMDKVRSFTIFDAMNRRFTFAPVPDIDKVHYVQVIAVGDSYRIYKAIKTTFTAANFKTDGVFASGNNYDSYEDASTYYVLDVKNNQLMKMTMRKKSLKNAFPKDQDKLNKFLKDNDGDLDDAYLSALGDYMNK